MPPGVEIFRFQAAQEVVIRNHSTQPWLYVVPGRIPRLNVAVSIPVGQLLYVWMDRTNSFATDYKLFPLLRGPD